MQLRDINYVVSIADNKSFSKAAEALYISQPALSQAIKRLEDELGVTLFVRSKNRTTLTSAGLIFIEDARKILSMSEHLHRQMSDVQELRQGALSIGMTPLFGRFYFAPIYQLFHRLYPGVKLSVSEGSSRDLEKMLERKEIEFAFLPLPLTSDELTYELIVVEETFLGIPAEHGLNHASLPLMPDGYATVSLSLFENEDFILLHKGQRLRELGLAACRAAGFEPRVAFETLHADTANSLVEAGMGVSFIPYMLFSSRKESGRAVYCHIREASITRKLVAAYRPGDELSRAAREFLSIAKETSMG